MDDYIQTYSIVVKHLLMNLEYYLKDVILNILKKLI